MSLFHFGKKKEASQPCCCSCAPSQEAEEKVCTCGGCCGTASGITSIEVLGSGCKSCHELYENAKSAAASLGLSDIDGKFLLLLPDAISRFLALHT